MTRYVHPLSDVQSQDIGEGTRIWQFCVVFAGAKIAGIEMCASYSQQYRTETLCATCNSLGSHL